MPACKSASSALTCSDVRDLSSSAVNSAIAGTCAHSPAGARRALRPPASYSRRIRREMAPTLIGFGRQVPDSDQLPDLTVRTTP